MNKRNASLVSVPERVSARLSIAALLTAVQPAHEASELYELRCRHGGTGELHQQYYNDPQALAAAAVRYDRANWDCYFGVHPRLGRSGTTAAVNRVLSLPVDLDAKLYGGSLHDVQGALLRFELPPTAVVCSGGGGHAYWRLDRPLCLWTGTDRVVYRQLADRLAGAVCGPDRAADTISDAPRILRLPGTRNHKYRPPRPVTLLRCNTTITYDAAWLARWLDEHAPWTVPPATQLPNTDSRTRSSGVPAGSVIREFNERYDVLALLLRHHAQLVHTRGTVRYLRRPGKAHGSHSATWNFYPRVLVVFSSEWPPFRANRGYDPFEVFTLLEHAGNHRCAYEAARAEGFGMRTLTLEPSPEALLLPPTWRPGDPLRRGDASA